MIDAARIDAIYRACLFEEDELVGVVLEPSGAPPGAIVTEGVMHLTAFNPARIAGHRQEISDLLDQLEDSFFRSTGGGMSLMRAPFDKQGHQWGEQIDADVLMQLGMAIGRVEYVLPRRQWSALPGSVPYYVIEDSL